MVTKVTKFYVPEFLLFGVLFRYVIFIICSCAVHRFEMNYHTPRLLVVKAVTHVVVCPPNFVVCGAD